MKNGSYSPIGYPRVGIMYTMKQKMSDKIRVNNLNLEQTGLMVRERSGISLGSQNLKCSSVDNIESNYKGRVAPFNISRNRMISLTNTAPKISRESQMCSSPQQKQQLQQRDLQIKSQFNVMMRPKLDESQHILFQRGKMDSKTSNYSEQLVMNQQNSQILMNGTMNRMTRCRTKESQMSKNNLMDGMNEGKRGNMSATQTYLEAQQHKFGNRNHIINRGMNFDSHIIKGKTEWIQASNQKALQQLRINNKQYLVRAKTHDFPQQMIQMYDISMGLIKKERDEQKCCSSNILNQNKTLSCNLKSDKKVLPANKIKDETQGQESGDSTENEHDMVDLNGAKQTQLLLSSYQKNLSFSIDKMRKEMDARINVDKMMKDQQMQYKKEGNQQMSELFRDLCSNPGPLKEQEKIRTEIGKSIKRVDICLDLFINDYTTCQTIDIEQISLVDPNQSELSVFLRTESMVRKTINFTSLSRQVFSADIFMVEEQQLPFDLKKLEDSGKQFILGQGFRTRIYRTTLLPKGNRKLLEDYACPENIKKRRLKEQQQTEENKEYAVKIIKFLDIRELEKMAREMVIEHYLIQQEFKHSCRIFMPTYCLNKKDHFQFIFLKELGEFNLSQLLKKRRESHLPYTEGELLQLFRLFLTQLLINFNIFGGYFRTFQRIIMDMHERQIAHRDIKPSNLVYMKKDRSWKIIDFGIATSEENLNLIKDYSICGTHLYATPQVQESITQGEESCRVKMSLKAYDLYSLGITFIRMKKLLLPNFNLKVIKQLLVSNGFDSHELTNIIIKKLTNKDEQQRIDLHLPDLITQISTEIGKSQAPFPNDYAFMHKQYKEITYSQNVVQKEDLFEKALTFKRMKQNDQALQLFFQLLDQDISSKLKANCLFQVGIIYRNQGNYLQSLEFLTQAKDKIIEFYPAGSIKYGEVFEEFGNIHSLLNKREESMEYYKKAYQIYDRNSIDSAYRSNLPRVLNSNF